MMRKLSNRPVLQRGLMAAVVAGWLLASVHQCFAQDDQGDDSSGYPGEVFSSNSGEDIGNPDPGTGYDGGAPGYVQGDTLGRTTEVAPPPACGMNEMEARAWSGLAGSSMLGLLAQAVNPPCYQATQPRQTVMVARVCMVRVAFEPVMTGFGPANAVHAVIVLSGPHSPLREYEGNPTGNRKNWGTLMAGPRYKPLTSRAMIKLAGTLPVSCQEVAMRMSRLDATLNNSGLPYWPAPETNPSGVNSNSYAFWAVTQLGLTPPPLQPWEGTAPGYYLAIQSN